MSKVIQFLRNIFTLPIVFYKRFISPLLPRGCIYTPSCSVYIKEAILKRGILVGFLFGFMRILRCNSLFKGGEDNFIETMSFKSALRKFSEFWVFRNDG